MSSYSLGKASHFVDQNLLPRSMIMWSAVLPRVNYHRADSNADLEKVRNNCTVIDMSKSCSVPSYRGVI